MTKRIFGPANMKTLQRGSILFNLQAESCQRDMEWKATKIESLPPEIEQN